MKDPRGNNRDEFKELCHLAYDICAALPQGLRDELNEIANKICDLGEEHQAPPLAMAAGVASIIGLLSLAMAEGDVNADQVFNDFLEFSYAALHTAVATARIRQGWTPAQ